MCKQALLWVIGFLSATSAGALQYEPIIRCENGQVVLDGIFDETIGGQAVGFQLVVHGHLVSEMKKRFFGPQVRFYNNDSTFVANTMVEFVNQFPARAAHLGIITHIKPTELQLVQRYFNESGTTQVDYIFRGCYEIQ